MDLSLFHSISPPFCWGGQLSVQILKRGDQKKKMSAWADLTSSCHGYLPRRSYYVSCQKKSFENKIWI